MNKQTLLGLIVILIGAAVILSNIPNISFFKSSSHLEAATHTINASHLKQLTLHSSSVNVKLIPHESDNISLKLTNSNHESMEISKHVNMQEVDDHLELTIDSPRRKWYQLFYYASYTLELSIPLEHITVANVKAGSGNIISEDLKLENLAIEVKSGNITINKTSAGNLSTTTTSGNIKLIETNSTNEVIVSATSGNINISNMIAPTLNINSKSGNLTVKEIEAKMITASATSGNVTIKGEIDGVDIQSGSGNLLIETDHIIEDSKLQSKSGNVELSLREQPDSLMITHQKTSGNTSISKSGFELLKQDNRLLSGQYGNGDVKLDITTTSGNFKLN